MGEWENGRLGEWEIGRMGDWEIESFKSKINNRKSSIVNLFWERRDLVSRFDLRLMIVDFGLLNEEEDLIQHGIFWRLGNQSVIGRDAAEKSFPEGEVVGMG